MHVSMQADDLHLVATDLPGVSSSGEGKLLDWIESEPIHPNTTMHRAYS
jgi:hypothetical protein